MESERLLKRALFACIALGFATTTIARSANASWAPLGVRLCEVPGEQVMPMATSDGFGGAFVVWSDYRGFLVDGVFDKDLYIQRVSVDGEIAPGWPRDGFEISAAPNTQLQLDVAPDGFGGCYVLWWDRSVGSGLYLTRVTAGGQRSPGWPAPGFKVEDQLACCSPAPKLIPDATGVFVVFDSDREDTRHVYVQRVTTSGEIASGWPLTSQRIGNLPSLQTEGKGVTDGAGGLVVLWEELRSSSTTDVFAIRLLPNGSPAPGWPENGIEVCTAPGRQVGLRAVSDGTEGAFLVWTDYRSAPPGVIDDSQFADVYAHHILPHATVDSRWPTDGLSVCVLPQIQAHRDICSDTEGGVFINWVDYRTTVSDVYVQRIRADGSLAAGWPDNGKFGGGDSGSDGVLAPPASDASGGVYLAWQRESFPRRTFTQHLTESGNNAPGWQPAGNLLVANNAESLDPWLVADGYGGAIVAWSDTRICGTCEKVFAQRIGGNGPTAVALSLVEARAGPGVACLEWRLTGTSPVAEFAVERGTGGDVFSTIATLQPDSRRRLVFDDHLDEPGRYEYRLRYQDQGHSLLSPTAQVDVPSAFILMLAGFVPNPAPATEPVVAFTLPRRAPGSLTLIDVSGRAIGRHDLSALGAGRHALRFGDWLNSGVYWIRLIHDGRQVSARGAIIR